VRLLNGVLVLRWVMSIAEIVHIGGAQAVRLPEGFQFDTESVSIRREGESVILEPVKPATWPEGFFEAIRIADPKFVRTDQGPTPPVPPLR
jgi:virulence-associated protein VagC